jgi:hypothetical protein|tara:strand:- start:1457 stop:1708 length:252 start_codon:yes stop_codon:yes gene_type:complete
MKKRKEYKIEITCADEKERNILFDIITQHELISTLYNNDIDNENFHTKHLVLLSETLTENLYSKLTERVRSGKGWTDKAYLKS